MDEVEHRIEGGLGRITLNRPQVINALNGVMVARLTTILTQWRTDQAVTLVLIEGAGDRGLCAGGDIRSLYESAKAEDGAAAAFFAAEYRMNGQIAEYPKPVVAIMNGIVMGGGIGVAGHASHRIVTADSTIAMPETGIGFFPDVGGTYLLGVAAPGELGTYMGLNGARIGPDDTLTLELADRFVPASQIAKLVAALPGCGAASQLDALIESFTIAAPEGRLRRSRGWIDACYAFDRVEDILSALDASPETDAQAAAAEMRGKSPTSLKQTLRVLRAARKRGTLRACLEMEYRTAVQFMAAPDFVEGVRAQIVDKDRNPLWTPAVLGDVTDAYLDKLFPLEAASGALFEQD